MTISVNLYQNVQDMALYKEIINNICNNIHTGLIDFDQPRSEASMPTQASSEFITYKQQDDYQNTFSGWSLSCSGY